MLPDPQTPFELAIGGVRFLVEPPPGWDLVEEDPVYRDFLGQAAIPSATETMIPVDLELGGAPDLEGLPLVFDTEETWSAHRDGDDLLLRLETGPDSDSYVWLVRMPASLENDPPAGRITVHCGALLQEQTEARSQLRNPLHYPLDQLLLAFLLPQQQGLVCHAAGFHRADKGVLFAGRSGAGKTTLSRLAQGREDLEIVSDDRVVIRRSEDGVLMHGTPWPGEGRMAVRRAVPLSALVFLHQAQENELKRLSPSAVLGQLLPVLSILWFDGPRMEAALQFCSELVAEVPAFELHFRPEEEALDVLDELF